MKPSIHILVAPDGSIQIEAVGFQGPDCEQATRFIEQALGNVERRDRKPEFHQHRPLHRQQRVGQ